MSLTPSRAAFAATALICALLAGCASTSAGRATPANREVAPDFTLVDVNGVRGSLSSYKGKVVLLNFWATWCGPCKSEIPWFIEFEKMYKDRGFAVLGVSMDEDGWQVVKPFVKQHAMNYTVMLGNDQLAQLYGGIESLPSTFLIDREGRIASVHLGLVDRHDCEAEIRQLIAQ
jgi:peroxiredoxin